MPSWSQFQGKLAQPNFPLKLQTSGQRLAMLVGWPLGCGRLDEMWILRDDAEDWWKWCIVWYTVYNIYIYDIYHLFVYSADIKSTDLNHKLIYDICTQCTQCTQLFSVYGLCDPTRSWLQPVMEACGPSASWRRALSEATCETEIEREIGSKDQNELYRNFLGTLGTGKCWVVVHFFWKYSIIHIH